MTCQYDKDEQCFESCRTCSRYKSDIECPECGALATRAELNRYEGKCWDCFFEQMCEDEHRMSMYIRAHKEEYAEYIRDLHGG